MSDFVCEDPLTGREFDQRNSQLRLVFRLTSSNHQISVDTLSVAGEGSEGSSVVVTEEVSNRILLLISGNEMKILVRTSQFSQYGEQESDVRVVR